MNKFKLGKDALILSILTLITALTWIGFVVYRMASRTTIPKVTQEQMKILNPSINKGVIEKLKLNLSFSESELDFINPPVSTEGAVSE